ncbi:MAG TPA: hypothetical protein VGP92_13445, partial [Acidimicrobiia bacterium]|nr:hypothetical protein [Acidimicrobiia bacterium]
MRTSPSGRVFAVIAVVAMAGTVTGAARAAVATTPGGRARISAPIVPSARARLDADRAYSGPVSAASTHAVVRTGSSERRKEQSRVAAAPGTQSPRSPSPFAPATNTTWHQLGPTNARFEWNGSYYNAIDSGRLNTVRVSATDPDTVYLGAADGGIWKTTNV